MNRSSRFPKLSSEQVRELTENEIEAVFGGDGYGSPPTYTGPEVIVIGTNGAPVPGSYPGPGTGPGTGGNYGFGASTASEVQTTQFMHQWDGSIDLAAKQVAQGIADKPDSSFREYSAYVYRDWNGVRHVSNTLAGNQYDVGNFKPADYGIPPGSILESFIHNHPTFNSDMQDLTNRGAPDNYDLSEVWNAKLHVNQSPGISVDTTNYRAYIVYDNNAVDGVNRLNTIDEYDRNSLSHDYSTSTGTVTSYPNQPKDSSVNF